MKALEKQRGVVMVDLVLALAVFGLLSIAISAGLINSLKNYSWLREESFKAVAGEAMANYMESNLPTFVANTVTVIDTKTLLDYVERGVAPDALADSVTDNWHYAACSITFTVTYIRTSQLCYFIGYKLPGSAPPLSAADMQNKTLSWWQNHASIEDLIVLSGLPYYQHAMDETVAMTDKVRNALEAYHAHLQEADVSGERFSYRYSNAAQSPVNALYFDNDSALLPRTAASQFRPSEREALGLNDIDLVTPFGEILFDNGSPAVRSPDNSSTPPYTAHVVVPSVALTVIATSIF